MNNVILIPSYCPGSMLTDLTKELVKDFQNVIESKNRSEAGISVPAKGLFLTEVTYNFK